MRGLQEKVVAVTGGGFGIGAATCRRLIDEGAHVAILDINFDKASEIAADLGESATARQVDVADEDDAAAALGEVVGTFGRLDGLVNNAGITGANRKPHEMTAEEWDAVIRVNVSGVFNCTKHAIPHLQARGGGSIVNLSSIYGIVGAPDIPAYHASKGAVREMTKVDALFYAGDGIRVNSVHPGFIWTPLVEELAGRDGGDVDDFRRDLDARHPIGHVGAPEDVAAGIAFLLSDDARFMTGSELVIDGGYICR